MIIMKYAKQTIYITIFVTTQKPIHSESPSGNHRTLEIPNFTEFLKEFEVPNKRGFELQENRRAESSLPPSQLPFIN